MIEIALCDDEPLITNHLKDILIRTAHLFTEPLHIRVFHSGTELLCALCAAAFDIIFLDIELGDITGIAVAEQIRQHYGKTVLVFVSAYESYCKDLFRFDTAAFLGKPVNENEVKELLVRAYKRLVNPQQVFTYHVKDALFRVAFSDILYFESKGHKAELVRKSEVSAHAFYGKLSEIETQLKSPAFVRIHHSFLVNLDNVERFENSALVLPGARSLPLSRGRQKEVRRKIMDYFGDVYGDDADGGGGG